LRKGRQQDLSLNPTRERHGDDIEDSEAPGSGSSGYSPGVSPFPLNVSPFVPATATDAGEDKEYEEEDPDIEVGRPINEVSGEGDGDGDDGERLLPNSEPDSSIKSRKSLFAKNSSGGHRWCSKCDAWKPDRCHHCRFCKRCTLKSEFTFLRRTKLIGQWITIVFGLVPALAIRIVSVHLAVTILTIRQAIPAVSQLWYLTITVDLYRKRLKYDTLPHPSRGLYGMDVSELTPVSFMLLTFIGAFFTMTIGGLAGYHLYLVW
jgi:hypothetical protein